MKTKFSIIFLLFFLNLTILGDKCDKARKLLDEANELANNSRNFKVKENLYKKAIRLSPECAEAQNNLGDLYEKTGKLKDAVREYKKAVKLAPNDALSYFGLGDVYYKTNQVEEAIAWYEKGLELEPHDPLTKNRLSILYDIKKKGVIKAETIKKMLTQTGKKRGITNTVTPMATASLLSFGEKLIPFDFNKWNIRNDARRQLDEIGKALEQMDLAEDSIVVIGHTDIRGTERYNFWLSMKRAQSVVNYLETHFNLKQTIFQSVGKGEMCLLCSETNEFCHAANRRVEIKRK